MSTPREIKAVDVVRGMRVRVTQHYDGHHGSTVETIEGEVIAVENANLQFGNGAQRYLGYDHPVTVLAEPEPEWVEGAWYWTRTAHLTSPRIRKRMERGWAPVGVDGASTVWLDNGAADITVLGRVLVVDWPGDDVARELAQRHPLLGARNVSLKAAIEAVADAIRTQGGVR